MTIYRPQTEDLLFVLEHIAELESISNLPGFDEVSTDLVTTILDEAGKFAAEVLAPLNRVGDRQGAYLEEGVAKTPDGWKEAYTLFVESGWNSISFSEEIGGQGLPRVVSSAVEELWDSANMAFALCPFLGRAAIEAIERHGSSDQKERYLPPLSSGQWTGTMNLTESQAGTDLSSVRTRAVQDGDHYRITGQKIFITYGDHDLTDNIVHLVLARVEGAPEGVKGISLFIVPKFLLDQEGNTGAANNVRTLSLEHKLGIHGSPTAVLSFGDHEGAVGYLVGEENRGLEYMFTMMNRARHGVGIEGVGLAERAYQQALAYSQERVQGYAMEGDRSQRVTIDHHPDVQRMLLSISSRVEAMRALSLWSAAYHDRAQNDPDADMRQQAAALVELTTPIVKGWCTETAKLVADLALQIHGGAGFIEETGIAQVYRDVRITTIYEGTTGIQALDLVGRKIQRDGGEGANTLIEKMKETLEVLLSTESEPSSCLAEALSSGIEALSETTEWVIRSGRDDPRLPAATSVAYLNLWGTVIGGWLLFKSALAAKGLEEGGDNSPFNQRKQVTARYYATQVMPEIESLRRIIPGGDEVLWAAERLGSIE